MGRGCLLLQHVRARELEFHQTADKIASGDRREQRLVQPACTVEQNASYLTFGFGVSQAKKTGFRSNPSSLG